MCRFRIRLRFLLRVYVRDGDDVLLHVRGGRVHRHARVRGDCGHDVRVHHHVRDGLLLLIQVFCTSRQKSKPVQSRRSELKVFLPHQLFRGLFL